MIGIVGGKEVLEDQIVQIILSQVLQNFTQKKNQFSTSRSFSDERKYNFFLCFPVAQ